MVLAASPASTPCAPGPSSGPGGDARCDLTRATILLSPAGRRPRHSRHGCCPQWEQARLALAPRHAVAWRTVPYEQDFRRCMRHALCGACSGLLNDCVVCFLGAAVCSATGRRLLLTCGVMCLTHWSGVATSSVLCSRHSAWCARSLACHLLPRAPPARPLTRASRACACLYARIRLVAACALRLLDLGHRM